MKWNLTSGLQPYSLEENVLKVIGNHQIDIQFSKVAIKVLAGFYPFLLGLLG